MSKALTIKIQKLQKKLSLAVNSLKTIQDWDDESEDLFGDPGQCAKETLERINN